MHHSNEPLRADSPLRKLFESAAASDSASAAESSLPLMANAMTFGATGRFPGGQLNETDEGEIQFGVACDLKREKVLIDFGKPVAWMATDAEQAISLGNLLVRHGKRLLRMKRA